MLLYFKTIHKKLGRAGWVAYISNMRVMNLLPVEEMEENETIRVSVTGCVKMQPDTKLSDGFLGSGCITRKLTLC